MSFIHLTRYISTGRQEEIRINSDHLRAYRKDCVDFKTVVHIGDTLRYDIEETPEEIDKLIEDANTGIIKFKELHKGDIIVLKSPIELDDCALERISKTAQDEFGDDNKVIVIDGGIDVDVLHKPDESFPGSDFTKEEIEEIAGACQ